MPRPTPPRSRKKPHPFSLILTPAELSCLRKIAVRENTSVGAVVRRAIHTIMFRTHPELLAQIADSGVEEFLNRMAEKFPSATPTGAKRSAFKKKLIRLMI